jgi:NADPH:quinone reductase-like Zn-dependent oxidoreductase
MRACAIERVGGPEMLTIHKVPTPAIGNDEVLIALDTAGVGSWDADMRGGWSPGGGHSDFPLILGSDGSGKIAAVGSHVSQFQLGDPVYAYSFANPKGGFYAEYVAVAADNAAPVPRGISMREAGAVPTTGLTALQGIDSALKLKRGENVVILGASGGVGTLAVQFAKLREARVLAVASGQDGVELVRHLGADIAIDGRQDNLSDALKNLGPIDALLALAGGEIADRIAEHVKPGGAVAWPNGVEPAPKSRRGIRMIPYDATAGVRQFKELTVAIEAAKLRVPIAAAFSLADASRAHERLAQGHITGKLVLKID